MKQEYDFSKGERGKFFHPESRFNSPVYLDKDVHKYLQQRAKSRGININQLVNEMLKQDIKLIDRIK